MQEQFNKDAHETQLALSSETCRLLLEQWQIDLIEAFAFGYKESGRLERSALGWNYGVMTDIRLALQVAGIRDERAAEAAAQHIVLNWGPEYVERAEQAYECRAAAGGAWPAPLKMPLPAPRMALGHVYVLRNPLLPGLVKIGMTTDDLHKRVGQLSRSTSIPTGFEVVAAFECDDPLRCERAVHAALAFARVSSKEFFRVSEADAVAVCRQIIGGAQ